jgi:hypothetical protein
MKAKYKICEKYMKMFNNYRAIWNQKNIELMIVIVLKSKIET